MSDYAQVPSASGTASKKFEFGWKRFHTESRTPVLVLDGDGTIKHMSAAARRMLEYADDGDVAPCFFSHVHARNMYQVMRDVADMVCYGKLKANWLVRLRTGGGQWQWVRATVVNDLSSPDRAIRVVLDGL